MWQTKHATAVPKKLGLGLNLWPCSEGHFLSGRLYSVIFGIPGFEKITTAMSLSFENSHD